MTNTCEAFFMDDPRKAYEHIDKHAVVVDSYGSSAFGHDLYVWDEGYRDLLYCPVCDAYILKQKSEYHGMEDDDYYSDYFPVSGSKEAAELNLYLDGYAIEQKFPRRYLMKTNHRFSWSPHPKEGPDGETAVPESTPEDDPASST